MKNLNHLLFAAIVAVTLTFADRASAQSVGDDGILASPKARQVLNERKKSTQSAVVTPASAGYPTRGEDGVAASPKGRQLLSERKGGVTTAAVSSQVASYQATGADGITASPKLRQQLGAQPAVWVAPVK